MACAGTFFLTGVMKSIRNNTEREIGLICNPAIILSPGEVQAITDKQIDELKNNSVARGAWADRIFDFIRENGTRIQVPRKPKPEKKKTSTPASGGPNFYRRDKNGKAIPISYYESNEYKKLLCNAIENCLSSSPRTNNEICSLLNRQNDRWYGKKQIDLESCFDILLLLEDKSRAETFDGGFTWAFAGTRENQKIRQNVATHHVKAKPGKHTSTFIGTGTLMPFDGYPIPPEILNKAIEVNNSTLIDVLALGRTGGNIIPPDHPMHDRYRDYFCSMTKANYKRLKEPKITLE